MLYNGYTNNHFITEITMYIDKRTMDELPPLRPEILREINLKQEEEKRRSRNGFIGACGVMVILSFALIGIISVFG